MSTTGNIKKDGSVIETRFDSKGSQMPIRPGFEFYRLHLFFSPLGHIALMQNIDETGKLVENSTGAAQDQIKLNAQGNFLEWAVLNSQGQLEKGNGPNVAIGVQKFDEYGYEIGIAHYDEKRNLITNHYGICVSETQFDKFGNIKERTFYDENMRPTEHQIAGYHRLVIEWDTSGNRRTKLRYFDLESNPVAHKTRGYHQVSYEYDDQDRLHKISYHDSTDKLVNRKDNGRAYTIFEYTNLGNSASGKHYDASGEELKL